jgi:hypothetical protein
MVGTEEWRPDIHENDGVVPTDIGIGVGVFLTMGLASGLGALRQEALGNRIVDAATAANITLVDSPSQAALDFIEAYERNGTGSYPSGLYITSYQVQESTYEQCEALVRQLAGCRDWWHRLSYGRLLIGFAIGYLLFLPINHWLWPVKWLTTWVLNGIAALLSRLYLGLLAAPVGLLSFLVGKLGTVVALGMLPLYNGVYKAYSRLTDQCSLFHSWRVETQVNVTRPKLNLTLNFTQLNDTQVNTTQRDVL